MPNHWEPSSFNEFLQAVDSGRCEIVLHGWTRTWARKHNWTFLTILFKHAFIGRLKANERDFWLAYQDGAFNLHLRQLHDSWGRPR